MVDLLREMAALALAISECRDVQAFHPIELHQLHRCIMRNVFYLFEHETQYLLEVLRRDQRAELDKAQLPSEDTDRHRYNARQAVRLLEVLNPRREDRMRYRYTELVDKRATTKPSHLRQLWIKLA